MRTLTTVSTGTDQTLPSPIRPVCAALSTTPMRSSASSSSHRTSTRTFGTRSTWYSAPRYTSVCPRCLPYPLASVIVRPWTPNACNAALTSSSLNGLMTAVMTFIWCPFGSLYRGSDADVVDHLGEHPGLAEPVLPGGRVEHQQHLVDRRLLLDHALDLAELIHQPDLGVQPAGRVHDDHIDPGLDALADRLERDAGGV